ncbi:UNVERIFIED_ORG: DNA-binding transcriptional ArsR family regulator [Arthrobacter sp. UYEF1]
MEIFAMLADATRVRLILALREGEMSVNDLAEAVGKPQSAVSQHLAKMRLARMVSGQVQPRYTTHLDLTKLHRGTPIVRIAEILSHGLHEEI